MTLYRFASAYMPVRRGDTRLTHFHGTWRAESYLHEAPLTDGKKECRAWTIRKGTKAPQAAGKIHSDFERGFIRASVIGYNDLEANNFDYAAVKAKGLQRTEGKEYVVHDGDVIEFLFNV